ncbi:MarR family transcriptional regulator [soil metagenome]
MADRAATRKHEVAAEQAETPVPPDPGRQNQEVIQQLCWDIASINVHLDGIRYFWAKELGISGPQWTILQAIGDLDRGKGIPVKDVSAMLHVDPSFITTQSKMLEKNGFIRRIPSLQDARVVLMSLSDKASKKIAALSSRREELSKFVMAEFDERDLHEIAAQIAHLKTRLEKAALMVAIDG